MNSHYKQAYQKFLFFVFACILPIVANSTTEKEIVEKRIGVAMRMIGHEVLNCLGDSKSRVMPIEKLNDLYNSDSYRVSFEFEFGFDPEEIVSITERVMTETGVSYHYFVEVEQCETKKVVHSFEVKNPEYSDLIPCLGRMLPEDCYSLLITILDGAGSITNSLPTASNGPSIQVDSTFEKLSANGSSLAFLIVSLLILMGFVGYYIQKKNFLSGSQASEADPNLILIGASQFDARNMVLSFEDKHIELSNKEAELLSLLNTSANTPLEREIILQKVWGDEGDYVGRTLDVFISKLRKKLSVDASLKIVNIRGVGYKLVVDGP